MRNLIQYSLAGLMACVLIGLTVLVFTSRDPYPGPTASSVGSTPSRMLQLGPVATGIRSAEKFGDLEILISASRLWVIKTKTFGFDNALLKKMAAKDFEMNIAKGAQRLISLSKPRVDMSLDQSMISIERPNVTFPPDFPKADLIRLDKTKKQLQIIRRGSVETWELEKL